MSSSKIFRTAFGAVLALFLTASIGGATAAEAQQKLTDSGILGVLSAVNRAEIQLGRLATREAFAGNVRTFAQELVDSHFAAELMVSAAGSPSGSDLSRKVETDAAGLMAKLQGLKGRTFDREYVESQVAMHRQILDTFDTILLPRARSRDVHALLTSLRSMMAKHLEQAQQLRITVQG